MIKLKQCTFEYTRTGARTTFGDGTFVDTIPHYTPHYHVIAHRCGYGDDLLGYAREHDLLHNLAAEFFTGEASPILFALAHGGSVTELQAAPEELVVMALQRFIRANERPIVGGIDWDALKQRALGAIQDLEGKFRYRPRLIVLGHARHGKDTVGEILQERFGYKVGSSSEFACEHVMMPYFESVGMPYANAQECFADRVNNRAGWFHVIKDYNQRDPARLAREMFEQGYEVYLGMRSRLEYEAVRKEFPVHVLWVDSSKRGIPLESRTSFDIDFDGTRMMRIANIGSLEDLERSVLLTMETLCVEPRS